MGEIKLRRATEDDLPALRRALYIAATWAGLDLPQARVLADDYIAMYHTGWGRDGDLGVVALDGDEPVGAGFGRLFTEDQHGHGYVDSATPEIAIGVEPAFRGRGVGGRLLSALDVAYRDAGVEALALSVEKANPAVRLYERHGYVRVREDDNACVMVRRLARPR